MFELVYISCITDADKPKKFAFSSVSIYMSVSKLYKQEMLNRLVYLTSVVLLRQRMLTWSSGNANQLEFFQSVHVIFLCGEAFF